MSVQPKAATPLERKETAATEREDDTSCHRHEIPSESSDQEVPSESCKDKAPSVGETTKERLGQFVTACIVVNYISAGYILLPRDSVAPAFAEAGLLLSAIVLTLVCLQSYSTGIFLLETCTRAEAMECYQESNGSLPMELVVRDRKYEIPVLARMFLGESWARFFCFTMSFDLYGITWAFCSVFATNLSEQIPLLKDGSEQDNYRLYVIIFVSLVVPLSCVSIFDQVYVQLTFLIFRMVMVILMLSTVCIALRNPDEEFFADFAEGSAAHNGLASFASLLTIIQTCIFATAFQFAVPCVAGVSRDKRRVHYILMYAVGFVFVSNLLLAVCTSTYFGDETQASSNLNWISFNWGQASSRSTITRIISYYIVIMAAVDGLAVRTHAQDKGQVPRASKLTQALGAFFVTDLGRIAQYAGIFTVLSYTLCPALLQVASSQNLAALVGEHKRTVYEHPILSSQNLAKILIVFAILLVLAVAVEATLAAATE
eukprot:scaffold1695_cov167-Amphora_coffeaeformis.AAC.7